MLTCTIKQRGGRAITFSRPGFRYVYADINGGHGTCGVQICHGGRVTGSTVLYYGDDQRQFEALCRKWYRAFMRRNRHPVNYPHAETSACGQ